MSGECPGGRMLMNLSPEQIIHQGFSLQSVTKCEPAPAQRNIRPDVPAGSEVGGNVGV